MKIAHLLTNNTTDDLQEGWSNKYKKSINCSNPKGFSQRAHCAGRRKRQAGEKTTSKGISEVFKGGYTLPNRWSGDPLTKKVKLPGGNWVRIEINWNRDLKYALVNFLVDGRQDITGRGDQFAIFSTVVQAIGNFIAKKRPNIVAWVANDNEESRIKLYDRLIPWMQKNGISPGYEDLTMHQDHWPDDLLGFIDEIMDPSGKIYVMANQRWIFSSYFESCNGNTRLFMEDLRKWFRQKWVRFGPDGKIRGACARGSDSEGKPKCLPQSKAHALGKKGRATAARRKRREDPNPERKGAAKMVTTKESLDWEDEDQSYEHLPSVAHAKAQLPRLLERAQRVYDNWDEEDRDTYAGGGICHIIADAICDVLSSEGIECATVSCSHEQHVYVAGKFAEGVYTIDIPYHVYETGGGFSWQKIPNVVFEPDHVVWYKASSNPAHFDQYTEPFESVIAEKKDACYHKVKRRYKVWPSAYASGALVQCRKKGAKNWGNKSK